MKPTEPGQSQGDSPISKKETPSTETKKGKMGHTSVSVSETDSTTKKTGLKRKFSELEQVTGRAVGVPVIFADFSRTATSLHRALFSSDGFKHQPFKLYEIGGSDMVAGYVA